jgi:hypothetical protein
MHEIRFTRRADLEAGPFDVGSTRAEWFCERKRASTAAVFIT